MRKSALLFPLVLLLSACASGPDNSAQCGTVSGYLVPDREDELYRVVVTHLNGQAVISKPNYQLAPGVNEFTVAELIDSPQLKVKLAARGTKTLTIDVKPNRRYHLGARFNQDKVYRGLDSDYWQPIVWSEDAHQCAFLPAG
ncbi:hypothetical protein [Shewanella algidipiscicola]|uniref:hypothetical protein n=1 Tax=Shewanella algidipiscicola TaxID=614070 RepID=UPI000D78C74A|nr:hypothetical protein [Shewanella algidipiscicola]